jgi:hypothetical protein
VCEPYLGGRAEPIGCKLELMSRLGCPPTLHRVAREEKWPDYFATCMMCDKGDIEDIEHILSDCSAYSVHRNRLNEGIRIPIDIDLYLGESTGSRSTDTTKLTNALSGILRKSEGRIGQSQQR